jgi:hypothetical protein
MVDDKGPLSGAEQAQAKALLGQYEKQGFLGPEQGFELLMLTAEALRRQVAAMGGETLPPTTESTPPQARQVEYIPGETVRGGYRFTGGDPTQKSSWEPVQ